MEPCGRGSTCKDAIGGWPNQPESYYETGKADDHSDGLASDQIRTASYCQIAERLGFALLPPDSGDITYAA
jgi:hypothetical protein